MEIRPRPFPVRRVPTAGGGASESAPRSTFRASGPWARHNADVLGRLTPAQQGYLVDNYGAFLEEGCRLDVCAPMGNGNQPVVTLQPADLAADPGRPFTVHTHYHGDIRPDDPRFPDRATIVDAMRREWQADPNTVFVLPQTLVFGAATTDPVGTQIGRTAWNNVSDQRGTMEAALQAGGLDMTRSVRHVVSGHSSGGYPLSRVMASTADDPSHPRLRADQILILDTVKGSWADGRVPRWWRDHTASAVTFVDATMHAFSPEQAGEYGWAFAQERDHFDAVKRWFDHRA